jgi:hypothetical protein
LAVLEETLESMQDQEIATPLLHVVFYTSYIVVNQRFLQIFLKQQQTVNILCMKSFIIASIHFIPNIVHASWTTTEVGESFLRYTRTL